MPKHYEMGGRVAPQAPGTRGMPPPGTKSWRERLGALRNLPPFLKMVWNTSPIYTALTLALRLMRALTPEDRGFPRARCATT